MAKMLPIDNYLVGKNSTNKTRVLQRMRKRQFTPQQPLFVIRTTSKEWQPDAEASIKQGELYARVCECEYERLLLDAE